MDRRSSTPAGGPRWHLNHPREYKAPRHISIHLHLMSNKVMTFVARSNSLLTTQSPNITSFGRRHGQHLPNSGAKVTSQPSKGVQSTKTHQHPSSFDVQQGCDLCRQIQLASVNPVTKHHFMWPKAWPATAQQGCQGDISTIQGSTKHQDTSASIFI